MVPKPRGFKEACFGSSDTYTKPLTHGGLRSPHLKSLVSVSCCDVCLSKQSSVSPPLLPPSIYSPPLSSSSPHNSQPSSAPLSLLSLSSFALFLTLPKGLPLLQNMAVLGLALVGFLLLSLSSSAYGSDGGWVNAHATFYGGGDASGTMGKHKSS